MLLKDGPQEGRKKHRLNNVTTETLIFSLHGISISSRDESVTGVKRMDYRP
jgi:hypothetical protein